MRRGFSRSTDPLDPRGFVDDALVGVDEERSSRSSVFIASTGSSGENGDSDELPDVREAGRCAEGIFCFLFSFFFLFFNIKKFFFILW